MIRYFFIAMSSLLMLTGCAGAALYSIHNETGQDLIYSSTSELWNPDVVGKVIPADKEVSIPFSPDFVLVDSRQTRRSYKIHYSIELADYFVPNWDASDSLQILVTDDHRVWLREKNGFAPMKEQPLRFGFPVKPEIQSSDAETQLK